MKKPLNRATSPIPPYGELAPVCGTSWSPIPNTTAQPMNRNVNRNFAFGLVIARAQRDGALGRHRRLEDDPDHQDRRRWPRCRTGWAAGRRSGTAARRDASRWPEARTACRGYDGDGPPSDPAPEANHCREPLRSTWALRRAPGVVDRRGVGRAAAARRAVRAPGAGRAERRRVHPRRPRVGARQVAARDGARRAAVGAGGRVQQPGPRGRHARVRDRGRGGDAGHPRPRRTWPASCRTRWRRGQVSRDRHTAYDIVFLDLSPDDSPDALPILRERLRPAPGLDVALAGGPAFYGDVQTVSRGRPPAERADLAAARRAGA